MTEQLVSLQENPALIRDLPLTSVMYYGGDNIGDLHQVGGMAFPDYEHYRSQRVLEFQVDATVVYTGPSPGASEDVSERWGVIVEDSLDNQPRSFNVGISPNQRL